MGIDQSASSFSRAQKFATESQVGSPITREQLDRHVDEIAAGVDAAYSTARRKPLPSLPAVGNELEQIASDNGDNTYTLHERRGQAWVPVRTVNRVTGDVTVEEGGLITALASIGVGQSFDSIVASRTVATWYQNVSGRPIFTYIRVQATSGTGIIVVSPDMIKKTEVGYFHTTAPTPNSFIVPPDFFVRVDSANASIGAWTELHG